MLLADERSEVQFHPIQSTYSFWAFRPVFTEAFKPASGSLRFSRCYMSDASIVLWLAHGNSLNVCVIVLWLAWPKHSPEAPIFHLSANRALLCICYCCFSDPASKLSFANKTRGGAQSQIFGNIFRGRSRWTVDSIGSRKHVVKDAKLVLQLNIFQFTKSAPSLCMQW